jgi:hypothetical protein
MMDSLCYESNGGSRMHGFCVFLSFRLSVDILLLVLCDYYEMLVCVRKLWVLLMVKYMHWLLTRITFFFNDDSLYKMVTVVQQVLIFIVEGF